MNKQTKWTVSICLSFTLIPKQEHQIESLTLAPIPTRMYRFSFNTPECFELASPLLIDPSATIRDSSAPPPILDLDVRASVRFSQCRGASFVCLMLKADYLAPMRYSAVIRFSVLRSLICNIATSSVGSEQCATETQRAKNF